MDVKQVAKYTAAALVGGALGGIIGASTVHDLPIHTDPSSVSGPSIQTKPAPLPIAPPVTVKPGLKYSWQGNCYFVGDWMVGRVADASPYNPLLGEHDEPAWMGIAFDSDQYGPVAYDIGPDVGRNVSKAEAQKWVVAAVESKLRDGGLIP